MFLLPRHATWSTRNLHVERAQSTTAAVPSRICSVSWRIEWRVILSKFVAMVLRVVESRVESRGENIDGSAG